MNLSSMALVSSVQLPLMLNARGTKSLARLLVSWLVQLAMLRALCAVLGDRGVKDGGLGNDRSAKRDGVGNDVRALHAEEHDAS